jgi:hypothetical protein
VSDPYESPVNPEIVIDTTLQSANEAADKIVAYLVTRGYLVRPAPMAGANGDKTRRDPAMLWAQSSGVVLPLSGQAGMEGQPASPDPSRR